MSHQKGLAMARLTEKELESFRGYAEANMVEPDGTQSQWADYTVRLIDELREARQTIQDIHMALTILRHDATDGQNWRFLISNACHELSTLRERIRELEAVVDSANLIQALWDSQAKWSQETFGTDDERGPVGAIKHLKKECDELLADPTDSEEYADAFLLILDAARRSGQNLYGLLAHAHRKHIKNTQRQWPTPTSDEPVEHVKAIPAAAQSEKGGVQ